MPTRNKALTLAVAAAIVAAASGCSSTEAAPSPAVASPSPSISVPSWLPAGFNSTSLKTMTADESAPIAAGEQYVATVVDGHIVMADPASGLAIWTSQDEVKVPALAFTKRNGTEYLIAIQGAGTKAAQVTTYRVAQPGPTATPDSSVDVSTEADISLSTANSGVLLSAGDARKFLPPLGQPLDLPKATIAVVNDAAVQASEDGSFSVTSFDGSAVWSSADITPKSTKGAGKFLGVSGGVIAASWSSAGAKEGLTVLIQAASGKVLSMHRTEPSQTPSRVLASSDGRWAVVGGQVMRSDADAAATLPEGLTPVAVEQGIVFGTADDESVAWDALSSSTLGEGVHAPAAVTAAGYGVFRDSTEVSFAQLNTLGGNSRD